MIQVFLLAPYASVRAGLRILLGSLPDFEIAGEARDADTLNYLIGTQSPDVVVSDASVGPLRPTLALLQEREIPLVALCEDEGDVSLLASYRLRGWAALQRSAGGEEIAGAIHAVVAGIVALDSAFAQDLVFAPSFDLPEDPEWTALTGREREVLQLMAQGLPNKNIAARLHISLSTAKFHVASILSKLDASSRTEAVTIGARRGLISL